MANTGQSLGQVLDRRYPRFRDLEEPIGVVRGLYHRRKRERSLVDYDDLLTLWLDLLDSHPASAERQTRHFQHLLVDEYQDTNAIQGRIVDRLGAAHRNVCVVGDDAQSIYSFRGAHVHNLLQFEKRYPDARVFRLEINYRSVPEILDLANASVRRSRHQLPKTLRPSRPTGLRPAVVPCADHLVQRRFIAEYILHLLDEGRRLTDIAVLYRSHWHAMEIQLELQRRDIPFQVRGGLRFFEQAHIKDVLCLLRLRHNGHDELAWQRALRLVPRIGGALTRRIWSMIAATDDPLAATRRAAAALPPGARQAFARFEGVLETLASQIDPAAMIRCVLDDFYSDYLDSRYENAEQRRQDLQGVADFAAQYRTVEAFLSDVALAGDFSGETCVEGPEEQLFVTLSTVHQAKGLEWPVVLIPWVADGRFPTDLAMNRPEDLEEERRVFHVAITRARDELYLLVPQVWSDYRRRRILMKPSRFLTELGSANVLETMIVQDDLPHVTSGL
jgi:DNA helicase-2/ATP-dependent DNA helicase PcrA